MMHDTGEYDMDTENNAPEKEELRNSMEKTTREIEKLMEKNQHHTEAVEKKLNEVCQKLNRIMDMIKTLSPEAYERISDEMKKMSGSEECNEGEKI